MRLVGAPCPSPKCGCIISRAGSHKEFISRRVSPRTVAQSLQYTLKLAPTCRRITVLMTRNKISAAALAALLVFAPFANVVNVHAAARSAAGAQDDGPSDAEQSMFTKGQNLSSRALRAGHLFLKDFLKTYPSSVITDLTLLWLGRSYMQKGRIQDAEQVASASAPSATPVRGHLRERADDGPRGRSRVDRPRRNPPRPAARPRIAPTPCAAVSRPATPTPERPIARRSPPREHAGPGGRRPSRHAHSQTHPPQRGDQRALAPRRLAQGPEHSARHHRAAQPHPDAEGPRRRNRRGPSRPGDREVNTTPPPVTAPSAEPARVVETIDPRPL